jgi:hypothetical protein
MIEKVTPKAINIAASEIKEPVNLVWAIYEFAIADIKNNGHLLSQKASQQKREQERLDAQQKRQKGRYDSSSKWSFGKIADGSIKAAGLFMVKTGASHLGTPLDLANDAILNNINTAVTGVSSVVGQFCGSVEGQRQGEIQTTGASQIEEARLKQTATSDDKRRTEDYSSSSNQSWMQALHQAAEGIKPR